VTARESTGEAVTTVFAICGSLGETSANRSALDVVARALVDELGCTVVHDHDLAAIPPLDPDSVDTPVQAVRDFRQHIAGADAVVIAAPEYAGSLAGAVKNALDWVVGSGELSGKPVGILSAGTTGGPFARQVLARTLLWQGALVVAQYGLVAPRTKSNQFGTIVDPQTIEALRGFARAVSASITMGSEERERLSVRVAAGVGASRSEAAPAPIGAIGLRTGSTYCPTCGAVMEVGRVYGDEGLRWLADGKRRPMLLTFTVEAIATNDWAGLPALRCRACRHMELQLED